MNKPCDIAHYPVYIQTLGCKVNQVESSDLAQSLMGHGIELTSDKENARITIINTCSVTAKSDAKVRKAIRKALSEPSTDYVIATGCSAAIQGDVLAKINERVVVEPDKQKILSRVIELGGDQLSFGTSRRDLPQNLVRTRVNLKISDGCEDFCSYCIVPFARGPVRPEPVTDLIKRVRESVDQGTKEIVLTGINIGTYHDTGIDLSELIQKLRVETGIHRIRISSIEPQTVTPALTELFRDTDIVCEHLHIPLQSGSDRVLKDMNRKYSTKMFRNMVAKLRSVRPDMAIHTDVIVGYPTETSEDFESTVALVEDLEFAGMHLFKYSTRPGTVADKLPALNPVIIEGRFTRLQKIADRNAAKYREKRLQSTHPLELLVERIEGNQVTATSREHISISWGLGDPSFPNVKVGDIVIYTEGSAHECLDSNAS